MTTRLVVRVKINNTTLCVSWVLVGQCISHKNTRKIWNFQLLCIPLKFEIDNDLLGIVRLNTCIAGRGLPPTEPVCMCMSYFTGITNGNLLVFSNYSRISGPRARAVKIVQSLSMVKN